MTPPKLEKVTLLEIVSWSLNKVQLIMPTSIMTKNSFQRAASCWIIMNQRVWSAQEAASWGMDGPSWANRVFRAQMKTGACSARGLQRAASAGPRSETHSHLSFSSHLWLCLFLYFLKQWPLRLKMTIIIGCWKCNFGARFLLGCFVQSQLGLAIVAFCRVHSTTEVFQ